MLAFASVFIVVTLSILVLQQKTTMGLFAAIRFVRKNAHWCFRLPALRNHCFCCSLLKKLLLDWARWARTTLTQFLSKLALKYSSQSSNFWTCVNLVQLKRFSTSPEGNAPMTRFRNVPMFSYRLLSSFSAGVSYKKLSWGHSQFLKVWNWKWNQFAFCFSKRSQSNYYRVSMLTKIGSKNGPN